MQGTLIGQILPQVRDIRRIGFGALDLCMVATGRVDAHFEHGLSPWDWAAGSLIASEAGAVINVPAPIPRRPTAMSFTQSLRRSPSSSRTCSELPAQISRFRAEACQQRAVRAALSSAMSIGATSAFAGCSARACRIAVASVLGVRAPLL